MGGQDVRGCSTSLSRELQLSYVRKVFQPDTTSLDRSAARTSTETDKFVSLDQHQSPALTCNVFSIDHCRK